MKLITAMTKSKSPSNLVKKNISDKVIMNVFENLHEPVCLINKNDDIVFSNNSFEKVTGFSKKELMRKKVYSIIIFKRKDFLLNLRNNKLSLLKKKYWNKNIIIKSKKGSEENFISKITILKKTKSDISIMMSFKKIHTSGGAASFNNESPEIIKKLRKNKIIENKKLKQNIQDDESFFRYYFNLSLVGVSITSPEKKWIKINDNLCNILGYGKEELNSYNWTDLTHPEDLQKELIEYEKMLSGKIEKYSIEKRFIKKDGSILFVSLLNSCKRDKDDKIEYIVSMIEDISERKLSEELLRQSEEKFSTLFYQAPVMLAVSYINDGKLLTINNPALEMLGFSREEVIGKTSTEIGWIKAEDRTKMKNILNEKGNIRHVELKVYGRDNKVLECIYFGEIIHINNEPYLLSCLLDITERIKTETSLVESEMKANALLNAIPDLMFRMNNEGVILEYKAEKKDLVLQDDSLVGKNLKDLLPADLYSKTMEYINDTLSTGKMKLYEYQLEIPLSGLTFYECRMIKSSEMEVISIVRNITERRAIENNLLKNIELLRSAEKIAHLGSWEYLIQENILKWSEEVYNIFGIIKNNFNGTREAFLESVHPEDRLAVNKEYLSSVDERRDTYEISHRIIKKDSGEIRFVYEKCIHLKDTSGKVIKSLGIVHDITEQRKAEESFRESEERLDLFFRQSMDGFFFMMINEPIEWNDNLNKEKILDYVFENQRITKVNKAMLDQYGAKEEDFLGLNPNELFKHDIEAGKKSWRELFDKGSLKIETDERRLDGSQVFIEGDYICLYDNKGRITGHFGVQRDITERKLVDKALRESRELYKVLTENSFDAILMLNGERNVSYISPSYVKRFGFSERELSDLNIEKILKNVHTADYEMLKERIYRGRENKNLTDRWEYRVRKKNGEFIWVEDMVKHEYDESGELQRVIINSRDITQRKRVEEELQQKEQQLRNALRIGKMGYWEYDVRSDRFLFNDNFYEILHTNVNKIGSYSMTGPEFFKLFVHPDDQEFVLAQMRKSKEVTDPNFSGSYEHRILYADGNIGHVSIRRYIIKNEKGETIKTFGVNQDITERVKIENELLQSKEKYRIVADYTFDWEFWRGVDNSFIYVSPSVERITGYPAQVFYDNPKIMMDIVYPGDLEKWKEHHSEHKVSHSRFMDFRIITKNKETKWISHVCQPIYDENGKYQGVRGTNRDITESMLEKQEILRLATIIEQSMDSIIIIEPDRKIVYVNDSFMKISGYTISDLIGKNFNDLDIFDEKVQFNLNMRMREGKSWIGKLIMKNKSGKIIKEIVTFSPIYNEKERIINFVYVGKDISHEAELESQLRQAQKMEAIGTLASGIAHDFNNILAAMMGFTEILLDDFESTSVQRNYLEKIYSCIKRATGVTKQILYISRKNEIKFEPIHINIILKETLKLLRSSLPSTIAMETDILEVSSILGESTQIHQIIMNLFTNARQAIGQNSGLITIKLDEFKYESGTKASDLNDGMYVRLIVADSGHGIESSVIERIFEPYFTTKEIGEGTGLGLAIVHGIVKNYGGDIFVESEINKGTKFIILFPITKEEQEKTEDHVQIENGRKETILVVDDEDDITEMLYTILTRFKYNVVTFTDSVQALEAFQKDPALFDVILTDMTMPKMIGTELSMEIRKIRKDIPIIICTGYSELLNENTFASFGINALLKKPIIREVLSKKIRELLEKKNNEE